jgi:hypothetical protein
MAMSTMSVDGMMGRWVPESGERTGFQEAEGHVFSEVSAKGLEKGRATMNARGHVGLARGRETEIARGPRTDKGSGNSESDRILATG